MIFFDIDETLLDHDYAEKMGAIDFFQKLIDVLNLQEDEFAIQWNALSKKYFEKYLAKELSFQEQRRMRMKEMFAYVNVELSDEEADMKFEIYLACYQNNWKSFEDVIPCLNEIQGGQLGIISNGDYKQQIEKLEKMGIRQFFSFIITSSEVGYAKPDVRIFEKARSIAGQNLRECFYVGDRLEVDAMGSSNAGMKAIWLNRKGESSPHNLNEDIIVIQSLDELATVINNATIK
ncbi:HAD family hydrolase [Paenibacillus sp. N3.4]|uniref:HAD family hydrolase n=1 Tax=Paenibacillus sp. N3.4 TaxID=2603222 RepID=UPI0011C761AD|nr:HAD family hydrolase [Paenibacillus sp. N3.4]TXK83748.1 HAD family hydrolase [Paenibacillus sp. N3.4]